MTDISSYVCKGQGPCGFLGEYPTPYTSVQNVLLNFPHVAKQTVKPTATLGGSTLAGWTWSIIGQHPLDYKVRSVVYYSLQNFTAIIIIRNAFAQWYK